MARGLPLETRYVKVAWCVVDAAVVVVGVSWWRENRKKVVAVERFLDSMDGRTWERTPAQEVLPCRRGRRLVGAYVEDGGAAVGYTCPSWLLWDRAWVRSCLIVLGSARGRARSWESAEKETP